MNRYSARPYAAARIQGGSDTPELSGEVRFYQRHNSVLVAADISGLPQTGGSGFFALHIHEGDRCTGEHFADTGGHYNPDQRPHPRHAGDLPPLLSCGRNAYMTVMTDRFRVEDILGRTVVIHSGPDDFRSQPAGNAGEKIGCGIIRRVP